MPARLTCSARLVCHAASAIHPHIRRSNCSRQGAVKSTNCPSPGWSKESRVDRKDQGAREHQRVDFLARASTTKELRTAQALLLHEPPDRENDSCDRDRDRQRSCAHLHALSIRHPRTARSATFVAIHYDFGTTSMTPRTLLHLS